MPADALRVASFCPGYSLEHCPSRVADACAPLDLAQKWSKGKMNDKTVNLVLFDEEVYAKLHKEVPKFKLITPSIISDRLKINGSLARSAIKELMAKGSIRLVSKHQAQGIYTRATNA